MLAQPAIIIPYTPKEETAKRYIIPTFISDTTQPGANGMTAHPAKLKTMVIIGANKKTILLKGLKLEKNQVWMSHGDHIKRAPKNFLITSKSNNNIISSIENIQKNIYGLQFHPEVYHSLEGKKIFKNFLFNICKIKEKFKLDNFINNKIFTF